MYPLAEAPEGMVMFVVNAPLGFVLKISRTGPVFESQRISLSCVFPVQPEPVTVTTVPGGPEVGKMLIVN